MLAVNIQHAADWLAERDYKSLAQSAGNLTLLSNLLHAKGDDPAWQNALAEVQARIAALQSAARSPDAGQCLVAN